MIREARPQPSGARVLGAEIHLREAFGRDELELLLVGASVVRLEEEIRPAGRQGLGDVADPGVVGRARRGGEPESRAGGDDRRPWARPVSSSSPRSAAATPS